MIKILLKHAIAELAIDNIFNGLITNFTPVPVMNGIMEIDDNGTKRWLLHGEFHRVDGPAFEYINGDKSWFLHGKCHRVDGPARCWCQNGFNEWWLNGFQYTEEDYWKQLK